MTDWIDANKSSPEITGLKCLVDIPDINSQSFVYVLLRDDKAVCFSEHRDEIDRMLQVYKNRLISKCYEIGFDNIFYDQVSDDKINIYEKNKNFLIGYDSIITSLQISTIPHFRTQMFMKI